MHEKATTGKKQFTSEIKSNQVAAGVTTVIFMSMTMKKIRQLVLVLATVGVTACYWGSDHDAYLWFSWTIDGYAASHDVCSDVGGMTVVVEEDPYGDGLPRWSTSFPCSNGAGRTSWHFRSYDTTHLRFRLLDADDAVLSETSWEPFWPEPGENIYEVDFETVPAGNPDASIHLEWSIDGRAPSVSTCGTVGADTVWIEHDMDGDDVADSTFDFPCSDGEGATSMSFLSGTYANVRYLLTGSEGTISQTGWDSTLMQRGVNIVTVDFNTSPVTPPDSASVALSWQIHFIPADAELCSWAGAITASLLLDENSDGEADRSLDFTCSDGHGTSEAVFEPGQNLRFSFALLDAAGDAISATTEWASMELEAGENNLGTVNFIVGNFGPLGVELRWAGEAGDTPPSGDCGFPAESVARMGYLLRSSDGTVVDEVDIEESPLDCTDYISWAILDYGNYELVVNGSSSSGGTLWGATCLDLVVDYYEQASNEFSCTVLMTP